MNPNIANNLVECEIKLRPLQTYIPKREDLNYMNFISLNKPTTLSKTLRSLLIVLLLSMSPAVWAQTILNSPYSYLGMGEIQGSENATQMMMGGIGVSNSNGIYTNMVNPALLARNRWTNLEVGVNTEYKSLQDYRQQQKVFGGNYQSLNLTLPISSRWTMAIGIRPHSAVEYETRSYRRLNLLGVDSLIYSYKGNGGVSKVSISNGVRIYKEFYVGLQMDYLFGQVNRNVATQNMSDGQYYKVQLDLLYNFSYKITKVNYISAKNGVLSLQLFVDVTNNSKIAFEISSYDLAIKINNGEKIGKVLNKEINQKFEGNSVNSLNFIIEISLVGTNATQILADVLSKGKKSTLTLDGFIVIKKGLLKFKTPVNLNYTYDYIKS